MSDPHDYEGEAISMAYDSYVDRMYDDWCRQQEEAHDKELEEEYHKWLEEKMDEQGSD